MVSGHGLRKFPVSTHCFNRTISPVQTKHNRKYKYYIRSSKKIMAQPIFKPPKPRTHIAHTYIISLLSVIYSKKMDSPCTPKALRL